MHYLLSNTKDYIEIGVIVVLGIFSIYQTFFNKKKEIIKEANDADDRLIKLLKDTVEELERKVKTLDENYTLTKAEVTKLRTENEIMSKILQGRDAETIEYHKRGIETMEKIDTLLQATKESRDVIENLVGDIQSILEVKR